MVAKLLCCIDDLCVLRAIYRKMPPKRPSTRSQKVSNLSKYLGTPEELIPNEVPTLRDVLRYILFLQRFKHDKLICDLINNAAGRVVDAWKRSNAEFTPPVVITKKAIMCRLQRAYNFFNSFVNKRQTKRGVFASNQKSSVQAWVADLDKLFDITKCRCTISVCTFDSAFCKPGCQVSG